MEPLLFEVTFNKVEKPGTGIEFIRAVLFVIALACAEVMPTFAVLATTSAFADTKASV